MTSSARSRYIYYDKYGGRRESATIKRRTKWSDAMKKDLLECMKKALLLVNEEEPPPSDDGRKQGKIMKDLWEEKGCADLGFTSQHLRDQAIGRATV